MHCLPPLRRIGATVLIALLCACAAQDPKNMVDAVSTPLNDLNMVHPDIPPVLARAQVQPYGTPEALSCGVLGSELQELDIALGPDIDAKATGNDPNLVERGINQAKGAAVGALRTSAQSLVPFRDWVRKLSGAEDTARKAEQAISAGLLRRAFLKGIRLTKECV